MSINILLLQAVLCADAAFLGLAGNAIDMDNIGIAQHAAAVIYDLIDGVCTNKYHWEMMWLICAGTNY